METLKELFEIKSFKEYQLECMKEIEKGEDCFVCQPTGSGKSIIFQALPFFVYIQNNLSEELTSETLVSKCNFTSLVISPLVSLMKDQESFLKSKGINVVTLHHKDKDIESTDINSETLKKSHIIFTSPEAILTTYRDLMKSSSFNKALKVIAIDESHCIKKWGSTSNQSAAFRSYYGRLSELRSLIHCKVPMVALTATATTDTKDFVINNLCLYNPCMFVNTPERRNIRYSLLSLKSDDKSIFLDPIIEDLRINKALAEKVLIFCRKMLDVQHLYGYLNEFLNERDYTKRNFAMFHASTDSINKDFVITEFSKENGTVRVLVATIAFGMGVNVKGLYQIIHYGPPAGLDDYFQEAGRAGRDGMQSEAILISYPRCITKRISTQVKDYLHNDSVCRRKLLLSAFNACHQPITPMHLCCDICLKNCLCMTEACVGYTSKIRLCNDGNSPLKSADVNIPICTLSKAGADALRKELLIIREKFVPTSIGHCGKGINHGFPFDGIKDILKIANEGLTILDIKRYTSVFNENCYDSIIEAVKNVSQSNIVTEDSNPACESDEESSDEESSDEDIDDESDDEIDNESDTDRNDYHTQFELSSESDIDF